MWLIFLDVFFFSSIVLKMLHVQFQTIEALSSIPSPELALRLYLQCAEVIYLVYGNWYILKNNWNL